MQKNSFKQSMLIVLLFTMQAVFGTLSAKPVSGRVTSATDGEPLIGATVQVQGSLSGVVTDLEGNYTIQAEQSQTPRVSIQSTSGQPGSGLKVNMRGLGTVGSSGPLYLINGIGGDINTLNPADIKSIDVLKDAASPAIYGAQAANGVVLVTTKHGRQGKAEISFDANSDNEEKSNHTFLLNRCFFQGNV